MNSAALWAAMGHCTVRAAHGRAHAGVTAVNPTGKQIDQT